jgi:ABC-2 type transport system permease protein
MRKLASIAWKDLLLVFRDPPALLLMLLTPYGLIVVMGLAFGGTETGISRVPVAIVNRDAGQLGVQFESVFRSEGLSDLLDTRIVADEVEARRMVNAEEVAAALIIPEGFSERVVPTGASPSGGPTEVSTIGVVSDPAKPVSVALVRGIAEGVLGRFLAASAGGQVAVSQLIAGGLLNPTEVGQRAQEIGGRAAQAVATGGSPIAVRGETASGEAQEGFQLIGYLAPSMAILFLIFTTMAGARTILAEREGGTLPRLLTTPTNPAQVLGGKVVGIFLTGVAQLGIVIGVSSLVFNIRWGSILGVVLLIVGLALAATGWGIVVAAFSRTQTQVAQIGSAIALTFAVLAGNFLDRRILPDWLRSAGYVTPNAWGLDGFSALAAGGGADDVIVATAALIVMSAVLFLIATFAFRRQYAK